MKRVVCLRLPHWPLQRWHVARTRREPASAQLADPAASSAPCAPWVVLQSRDSRRGECVTACSQAAWACGVRVNMPLPEALALLRRGARRTAGVTAPVVERHDPAADLAALRALAERCERFSPLVGWETVAGESRWEQVSGAARSAPPPAHLWLDITGIGPLFGGEAALVRELRGAFREWGYVAYGAVADSAGAAWACADAQWEVVPPGNTRDALAPRPVASLRLPPATVELLRQLGVERVAQLWQLPREGLAARFGPGLTQRLDQALGTEAEWLRPYRAPPPFHVDRCLDEPTSERTWIEHVVENVLHELGEQLRGAGVGALELRGRVDCAAGTPVELKVGLFRPSACARHWSDLVRMQLERITWPGPIGRVGFQATATAPLAERQRELFERHEGGDERWVGNLLERLGSRLGATAVWRPRLSNAALPERAYRYEPALGGENRTAANSPASPRRRNTQRARRANQELEDHWRHALRPGVVAEAEVLGAASYRPLELVQPPRGVEVMAIAPDGPPQAFHWERQLLRIGRFWGPERIETGWWRGDSARRDYYRVETESGLRYWLFRDLVTGDWFLHGVFD